MRDKKAVIMGNLCSSSNKKTSVERPPQDVTSLLEDVKVMGGVDNSHWGKSFREFIKTSSGQVGHK